MLRLATLFTLIVTPWVNAGSPVTAIAYRPDTTLVAAGEYGVVHLIDPATAKVMETLTGFKRQVTAIQFSPDSQSLVVASGEPSQRGEIRCYIQTRPGEWQLSKTLDAHKDLIYSLSWSDDGKTLASAGYDRIIRLWGMPKGELLRTLTDHSDTIYSVAFQPKGKLLASVSADRAVKIWDPATGTRLYTLGESTDWVYSLAWSADGERLAAAGVDKSIRVWQITPQEGKLVHGVFAHEGSVTHLQFTRDGKTLYSLGEDRVLKSWDAARMVESRVFPVQPEAVLAFNLRPDGKQLALGRFDGVMLLLDAAGQPMGQPLPVPPRPKHERFPAVMEREPNQSPNTGQVVTLPVTFNGTISQAGDTDYLRFTAKVGESIGIEVITQAIGSKLDAVVELVNEKGRVLMDAENGLLGYTFTSAGNYAIGIRDREYRGTTEMTYSMNIGPIPMVTGVFPLSLPRGDNEVTLQGVFLDQPKVKVTIPASVKVGSRVVVPLMGVSKSPLLGKAEVIVAEFPERTTLGMLSVPSAGHGVIADAQAAQVWPFAAKKGERLIVEVHARRFASPLDSIIDILDDKGQVVPQKTLRSTARTYSVFRDHDSANPGIRIENWNELTMRDYIYLGSELMQIDQLPKNPDDDCRFVSIGGKRAGMLGTTPTHHSNGSPLYKVELHPPGSKFPPNGLPVFSIPYRNDDGQGDISTSAGKDSQLFFDPPADGNYAVRVQDARGQGRIDFAYRVTVRPPQPDYSVTFTPTALKVWKGNGIPITVTVDRVDGFTAPIDVKLEGLPPGFIALPTRIDAAPERTTIFTLWAAPDAIVPPGSVAVRLKATSQFAGREWVREAVGEVPQLVEPGDLQTSTTTQEVVLVAGQETRLTVNIERRNGFTGRVPLDVRGLPYGVRVQNIGLNGILVTPGINSREIVLYAEPWVEAQTVSFVVLSRREGKNSEHAAKPVMLKITR